MSLISDHRDTIRLEAFPPQSAKADATAASEFEAYSDLRLWREFKKGSRSAFIYIYHTYFDRIYNYAHQFTPDTDLVKDCIQDLFIELNNSKSRLSDTDSIHLYLFKATKRKLLRAAKRKIKVVDTFNSVSEVNFFIELSVEQKMINRQIDEDQIFELKNSINKLTDRQREAIFYFYYEGFSLAQVKELMGIQSIKATQNLIYKAIKELRKMLILFVLVCF